MNFSDFELKIVYSVDGKSVETSDGDSVLGVVKTVADDRITVTLNASRKVEVLSAKLLAKREYSADEAFFAAGYQSWTTSREYTSKDRQRGLRNLGNLPVVRQFAAPTGDYDFAAYGRKLYHSVGYTYFRNGDNLEFFGSLDEKSGFTLFYADMKQKLFAVTKDVEGLVFVGEYKLFDVVKYEGGYDEVFDKYFAAYPLKFPKRAEHLAGYTSWYNYFQKIDEKIILRDLKGLSAVAGDKANIFQIDDGYEPMVGDWLLDDKVKFPNGMKYIADVVHSKGYLAGLWVAPFSAQFKAKIVTEHPDWFLTDEKGKKIIGGFAWNGFYVLDTEKPEVRDYVKKVFRRVFDEWGFDMVKLDFLYSACILPRNGKTRGQLMHEAMEFLRECVGDKLLLGCGVPTMSSFGFVDACRISCDVELSFADKFYVKCTNQEVISAKNAMNNSVFRRHLNKRIFLNDPDVFFLRDGGMKRADFTFEQKKLLAKVNNMFGNVLFVSDNAAEYDSAKKQVLLDAYKPFDGKILRAYRVSRDRIRVDYVTDGVEKRFEFDLATGENTDRAVK